MNQSQKIEKGNQMRKCNKINKINQVFASILLGGAILSGVGWHFRQERKWEHQWWKCPHKGK